MKNFFTILILVLFATTGFAQTTLVNEGFDSGLGVFSEYSASGNQIWVTDNFGEPAPCAKMSGYAGRNRSNEDWMISPALDFSGASNISLSFNEAINYENNVSGNCQILVSTNYSGSGNPNNANWEVINMPSRAAGSSWTFIYSGEASLNSVAGQSDVYVAFRYLSSRSNAGTWEVDNIKVVTDSGSGDPDPDPTPNPSDLLDVVTFNIEWLGRPDKAGIGMSRTQQIQAAAQEIINIGADVYALQEIVIDDLNGNALADLVAELNALDGNGSWGGVYNSYFSFWWDPDFVNYPAQRQAFVYRTSTVQYVSDETLLTWIPAGDNRFASGRLPFMLTADVTINGITQRMSFVNLHLKCCTGNSGRRRNSMEDLVAELNASYTTKNMVVLGDFNVADNGGADGEIATWGVYDDKDLDGKDDYSHAAGATQNLSWGDIDHVLISDELVAEYQLVSASERNVTVASSVSDHDPVVARMNFTSTAAARLASTNTMTATKELDEVIWNGVNVYPNPANSFANVYIGTDQAQQVKIEVVDLNGHLISSQTVDVKKGGQNVLVDMKVLEKGVYLFKVNTTKGSVIKKVIKQ